MTPQVQGTADRAEIESIHRFRRLNQMRGAIEEAARRADAYFRLETALHYGVRSSAAGASDPGRAAGWERGVA